MRRGCWALGLVAACCVAGAPDLPAEPFGGQEEASRQEWQARFQIAHDELDAARSRHEAALEAYRVMRHRKRRRGEAKRLIIEELERAAAALPEAERRLHELRAEARSSGIPRGWTQVQPQSPRPAAPDPGAAGRFDP